MAGLQVLLNSRDEALEARRRTGRAWPRSSAGRAWPHVALHRHANSVRRGRPWAGARGCFLRSLEPRVRAPRPTLLLLVMLMVMEMVMAMVTVTCGWKLTN